MRRVTSLSADGGGHALSSGRQAEEFACAEQALAAVHAVVSTIGAEDVHRATPCPDWDVAALAVHLVDTIARLGAAAGIGSAVAGGDSIDDRISDVTQNVLAEWRRRGLRDDVVFSGRTLPARLALGIASLELLVHGWDFAVALDRRIPVSDAVATHVLGLAGQTLTAQSRKLAGFDPPVPVPADATALDRLVAFTGRDPRQMERAST